MSHEFQTILFLKTSLLKPNQNSEELSFHINLTTFFFYPGMCLLLISFSKVKFKYNTGTT